MHYKPLHILILEAPWCGYIAVWFEVGDISEDTVASLV